jgi:hypothetical protein
VHRKDVGVGSIPHEPSSPVLCGFAVAAAIESLRLSSRACATRFDAFVIEAAYHPIITKTLHRLHTFCRTVHIADGINIFIIWFVGNRKRGGGFSLGILTFSTRCSFWCFCLHTRAHSAATSRSHLGHVRTKLVRTCITGLEAIQCSIQYRCKISNSYINLKCHAESNTRIAT